jgi:hypothetical protein
VGEAVLNYLVSSDVGDHRLLQLIDFLSQGGMIGEVEVLVSQTMAACGYGRFMVEVSISIPVFDDDGLSTMHLVDRKLFLFSAGIGAIVWMGESNPLSQELRPRQEEMVVSYLRRSQQVGGSRPACSLAIGSGTSPAIMVAEITPSGNVQTAELLQASLLVRSEILEEGWEMWTPRDHHRPLLLTSTDVVAADTLVQMANGTVQQRRSIVSFYPRYPSVGQPLYSTVMISGDIEVIRMACIRDQHVLLLCRRYVSRPGTQRGGDDYNADPLVEGHGHWFGDGNGDDGDNEEANEEDEGEDADTGDEQSMRIVAVIIHVPSRREISRMQLLQGVSTEVPHVTKDCHETIGVGLSWKGVVMTGSDVRSVTGSPDAIMLEDRDALARFSKKKKKQKKQKTTKKDGFARGMSLRG